MTVSYNLDVSSTSLFGFMRLQLRWRGSIWKCVALELSLFCTAFLFCSSIYHSETLLSPKQKKFWEDLSALFDQSMEYIPLTFMLGFFVTIIVGRWNEIFNNIGWIDPTALVMATYLRGSDEKSRIIRRNIIRYLVLTQVLVFRDISMQVRKRFPTIDTLVAAGLMMECERDQFQSCPVKYQKYFLPIQWAFSLLYEARVSGKISCDLMLNEIIKNILEFRKGLAQLSNFDWVPVPLVYPQVVFLAVRSYFAICLIARQSVLIDGRPPDVPHPIFPAVPFFMTALQFIFYVGWMKVAENLMNPLGEDDDDFECNFLIDRNLSLGLCIVDDNYNAAPPQQKDIFWNSEGLTEPLYSSETASKPIFPQVGSVANYEINKDEVYMMHHVDADAEVVDGVNGDEERLLPRGVSVVSVNHAAEIGSRTSLSSRKAASKGILNTLRKQLSRDNSTNANRFSVSRPNRLMNGSEVSLNTPTLGVDLNTAGSSIDILNELAMEAAKNAQPTRLEANDLADAESSRHCSPTPQGAVTTGGELLTSVPEEDEEAQRTRTSIDYRLWQAQMGMAQQKKMKGDEDSSTLKN